MTQAEAFDILKTGANVFLTGAAGSGKTYLLNQYIAYARDQGIEVAVTASTGIAATHANGITLHAWAGFGVRDAMSSEEIKALAGKRRYRPRFAKTKILVIDEVSMLHARQLDMTDTILRYARSSWEPFGGLQVILCGDFFQLPPVERRPERIVRFCYDSEAWRSLAPMICYLEEQFRQEDQTFLRILNDIRSGAVNEETRKPLRTRWRQPFRRGQTATRLFTHNADVDAVNLRELENLKTAENVYRMETFGPKAVVTALKDGCLAPEELRLKIGASVMFLRNNFEAGYVNGTLGTVIGFDQDSEYPIVQIKNKRIIVVSPEEWRIEEEGITRARLSQIPLRLAWAITVHKSQGMTIDAAEVDLSKTFEKGMGYVALSRVRSLSDLSLTGMNELAFLINEEILATDSEFRTESARAKRELAALSRNELNKRQQEFSRSVKSAESSKKTKKSSINN